jgi:two-component system sensor histidine kinase/response regulator
MNTLKVLAVDDEKGMTMGIHRALDGLTINVPEVSAEVTLEVATAVTGEEAVEILKAQPVDILLLDYKLPGINGLEVLEAVGDICPDMLTVMITAYASIETAIVATKRGAYDFLPKPFTPADLKHTVRRAVIRIMLAREARRLEAEKKQVRFEFIRVLGHELKAPIGAVAGYLYLLRDKTLGNDVDAYGELVGRSLLRLEQMRKLIADLLDMTRLESGQKKRQLEVVNVGDAASDAIELIKGEADARGIRVLCQVDQGSQIQADRGEIDMILNNLLTNAVKYNKDNGEVDIKVVRGEGELVIRVADTGIGMTDDEQKLLFHEFSRIKNAETREVIGSGLGLSILQRLADLYSGEIDVTSEKGKGSVFTVTLRGEVEG